MNGLLRLDRCGRRLLLCYYVVADLLRRCFYCCRDADLGDIACDGIVGWIGGCGARFRHVTGGNGLDINCDKSEFRELLASWRETGGFIWPKTYPRNIVYYFRDRKYPRWSRPIQVSTDPLELNLMLDTYSL
jgi:hypothetical protein